MKVNLWFLAEQLEEYGPIEDISEEKPEIEGVRICDGAMQAASGRHVCLYRKDDGTCLRNGNSSVLLPHVKLETAMNAVLDAFERIQVWEAELTRLTAQHSLQNLIDCGSAMLGNPLTLSSSTGDVLAMSNAYLSEDVDPYWSAARDTGRFPLEALGAPMYAEEGTLSSWNDSPTLFRTQSGGRLIGSYIRTDDSQVGLGLLEYKCPIRKGDLLLYNRLRDAIASALEEKAEESAGLSEADLLRDILDGRKIEPKLLSRVESGLKRPWQMILVSNPFRSDNIHLQSLLYRAKNDLRPNISFLYENRVVMLMAEKDAAARSKVMALEGGKLNHQLVVSLPFDELDDLLVRYRQCAYTMEQTKNQPGIYNSERFCFAYLLSRFTELNREQNLSHPALAVLKRYDQKKNTEYYRTLFVYLLYERSILLSAQSLHIHKNSFLYRIQKIRDMVDVDLDDSAQRMYLMLSYYMEGENTEGMN